MGYEFKQRLARDEKRLRILDVLNLKSENGSTQISRSELMKETSLTLGQFLDILPKMKNEELIKTEEQFSDEYGNQIWTIYTITEKGFKFLRENRHLCT